MATSHSPLIKTLQHQLVAAREHDEAIRQHASGSKVVQVPSAGKILSSAYEQLRNAAEYSEEHLVLERAIRRFYKRTLFVGNQQAKDIGYELIVELTQAGYLRGNEYGVELADTISKLAADNMLAYDQLRGKGVHAGKALDWTLAILSVRTENLLSPHSYHSVFAGFAYQYFMQQIPKDDYARSQQEKDVFEVSIYVAVHQGLLKSDIDVVRSELLNLYSQTTANINDYITWNKRIDELYTSSLALRLKRTIVRNGAPFRVLRSMIEDNKDLSELIDDRDEFMQHFNRQINKEYKRTAKRLDNGVVKSIIFLLITKVIIGLAIEVPYDLVLYGMVARLPLVINLLFPPLYMASIRLGLSMPGGANTRAASHYMEELMYSDDLPQITIQERNRSYPFIAKLTYTLLFFVPIMITVYILQRLHFNEVQMIIFFLFFSTASFLGFRLRSMIRELTMSGRQNSMVTILGDFFYLPFIILGQWLSSKYAKINLVGKFLDIAIEMPLKTVLRLLRQWVSFLNERHEEIY